MVGHTCRCYQGKALQAPDKQTSCEWGGVVVAVSYQMSQLWQSKEEGKEGSSEKEALRREAPRRGRDHSVSRKEQESSWCPGHTPNPQKPLWSTADTAAEQVVGGR